MEDRPIAGAKRAHRGWRRHQLRIAQWPSVFLVPRLRPSKRPPARDQAACGRGRDHHAIRQLVDRQGQWMQALAPVLHPLAMKHLVDPSRIRSLAAIARGPGGTKALGRFAAAEKTGAMSGGERRRLVEEEQLGPTAATHHVTPHALVFADARSEEHTSELQSLRHL